MQSFFKAAITFAELLSCGFATIGVPATLVAVSAQLASDAFAALTGRGQTSGVEI